MRYYCDDTVLLLLASMSQSQELLEHLGRVGTVPASADAETRRPELGVLLGKVRDAVLS